ncbi:MAG: sodium:solute symporter, partial [Rikenellaceae bacterium]
STFGALNWSVLVLYLLGMLGMGWYFMRRSKSTDDFFKGGGRIPWWAAAISLFATMLSAITFMAIPAKSFATDLKYFPMAITILIMAFPVMRYYLPFFIRLNVTTAYQYLENRFNYAARFIASALFIIFMITRIALTLYLPSLALTVVTGIDINLCIIMMGVITLIYCTMGGVEAVVWSDVVQGAILMGGAIFAVIFLISNIPGGFNTLVDISISQEKFTMFDFSFSLTSATFWVILLGGLANNLISYTSDQTAIQRYITTSSEKDAKKSILLNGIMSVLISVVFYFIGTCLYSFYKSYPQNLDYTMQNTDSIFPYFIMAEIPIGFAGLIIAAIFAATMSTVSSNVNSLATAFTVDIYRRFAKSSDDKRELNVARISGATMGSIGIVLAIFMASWNILSLLDFFNLILGFLSSGIAALFFAGIFIPRIGSKSVLIGFILGNISLFVISNFTPVSFLLYGFSGTLLTVVFSWLLSFVFKNEKDVTGYTWKTIKKAN